MAFKEKRTMYDYNNAYTAKTYDRMQIIPRKEEGQRIREAAAKAGESVSAYILGAVRERMEKETE